MLYTNILKQLFPLLSKTLLEIITFLCCLYFSGWLYDIDGTFNLTLILQCVLPLVIPVALAAEPVWSHFRESKGLK